MKVNSYLSIRMHTIYVHYLLILHDEDSRDHLSVAGTRNKVRADLFFSFLYSSRSSVFSFESSK